MNLTAESELYAKKLQPEEALKHFKAVVKSLMGQAEDIVAQLELTAKGPEVESNLAMLDHCIDYTRRMCSKK